jgi:hypothetical protein
VIQNIRDIIKNILFINKKLFEAFGDMNLFMKKLKFMFFLFFNYCNF